MHRQWLLWRGHDAIIPVPMFAAKERQRGYNQAMVLARFLAAQFESDPSARRVPIVPIVKRSRKTTPQKELSIQVRRKNLKKAFKIDENVVKLYGMFSNGKSAPFRSVLLVDDIYTTGATLDTISELLLAEGVAEAVDGMTVAISQDT